MNRKLGKRNRMFRASSRAGRHVAGASAGRQNPVSRHGAA